MQSLFISQKADAPPLVVAVFGVSNPASTSYAKLVAEHREMMVIGGNHRLAALKKIFADPDLFHRAQVTSTYRVVNTNKIDLRRKLQRVIFE